MSSSDVNTLVDMGFNAFKATMALQMTGNRGVVPAMEWLFAHSGDIEQSPELPVAENASPSSEQTPVQEDTVAASGQVSTTEVTKCIKCDICGRLFRSKWEVEFHASKYDHDKFSETTEKKKPLSEKEEQEQLQAAMFRLSKVHEARREKELKDAQQMERDRIKAGKEMTQVRRKMEELEMKKLLEEKKREREEKRQARQNFKNQIEVYKIQKKSEKQKTNTVISPLSPSSSVTPVKKEYNETKLQIRLTNGQILKQSFGTKEPFSSVRVFVEMNRTDTPGPFTLLTNFPRKVFTEDDYETPLNVLGLVPSAVLIVQKKVE